MASGTLLRVSAGSDKVLVHQIDDPIENVTGLLAESVSLYGVPVRMAAITNGAITAIKDYPDDGTGIIAAVDNTNDGDGTLSHLTIASGAPDLDLTGLLIVIWSGTQVGQVRRIRKYTSPRKYGFGRTFSTLPTASTDTYRILIPTFRFSELHLKSEFHDNAATAPSANVMVALYDYGQTPTVAGDGQVGILGTARVPRRFMDTELTIDNQNHQDDITTSTFYHGVSRTTPVRGALGAKVRLSSAPAGGNGIALWAGAT